MYYINDYTGRVWYHLPSVGKYLTSLWFSNQSLWLFLIPKGLVLQLSKVDWHCTYDNVPLGNRQFWDWSLGCERRNKMPWSTSSFYSLLASLCDEFQDHWQTVMTRELYRYIPIVKIHQDLYSLHKKTLLLTTVKFQLARVNSLRTLVKCSEDQY